MLLLGHWLLSIAALTAIMKGEKLASIELVVRVVIDG